MCPVNFFGTHLVLTSRSLSHSQMILWTEHWLTHRWCCTKSLIVMYHLSCSFFIGDICVAVVFCSYMVHCNKALFPYYAESLRWISAPGAVLAWQDKKHVTMISTYHKDDMRVVVTKANWVQSKPVVVCYYHINMLGVDLKEQMLQSYLFEWKKSNKVVSEIIQEATQCSIT
jgi:hypothetical protein